MKVKIHIPTMEYGFIEVELEQDSVNKENLFEDIVLIHDTLKLAIGDKEGLNQKDWARVRNTYLNTGEIEVEEHESLSKAQRFVINEIKKSIRNLDHGIK